MAELMTPAEVAAYLGISKPTLLSWRKSGYGPTWIQMTARIIRYRSADVEWWLDDQEQGRS